MRFLQWKNRGLAIVVSSAVAATGVIAISAFAATTISTSIQTGGTLSVTGTSTLIGNVAIATTSASSALTVWGPDTSGNTAVLLIANSASSSEFQVFDNGNATLGGALTVSGNATSTFAGGVQATNLNLTSTAPSSTASNGINLTGGCYAVNGTCVGGGSSGAMTLISTQTANNSATLQWTNLPTTYNTLELDCDRLVPQTTDVTAELQFGEGSTPTWKTSGYSGSTNFITVDGHVLSFSSNPAENENFYMYVKNTSSSSLFKTAYGQSAYFSNGNFASNNLSGAYTADANPITAIRFMYSSGNITSGQCSLYGLSS